VSKLGFKHVVSDRTNSQPRWTPG